MSKKNITDILFEFTEELIKGNSPQIKNYVSTFKGNKTKLKKELTVAKIAFLMAHPELDTKETDESLKNLIKNK